MISHPWPLVLGQDVPIRILIQDFWTETKGKKILSCVEAIKCKTGAVNSQMSCHVEPAGLQWKRMKPTCKKTAEVRNNEKVLEKYQVSGSSCSWDFIFLPFPWFNSSWIPWTSKSYYLHFVPKPVHIGILWLANKRPNYNLQNVSLVCVCVCDFFLNYGKVHITWNIPL